MKFFIQTNITMLKNYFRLKYNKNYVEGLCIKMHFRCQNVRLIKKKLPPI